MKPFALLALLLAFAVSARADDLTAAVQTKLTALGYFQGKVDGAWGPATSNAVSRFQRAKDLRVTGALNPATLNALGIKPAPAPGGRTASGRVPMDPAQALVNVFVGGPYLNASPEFQIQTVREAQKNLKLLGYYGGPINGSPDGSLTAALKLYQKDNRFRQTGRLDGTTLQGLGLLTVAND